MMKDQIAKLLETKELSEEFKLALTAMIEDAVETQVKSIKEESESTLKLTIDEKITELELEVDRYVNEIVLPTYEDKIDSYLNYAVNEWSSKNEIGIESGVKIEIAESMLNGVKSLVESHNVNVDGSTTDLIQVAETSLAESKVKLNDTIAENITFKKEIETMKRLALVANVCESLTESQKEKIIELSEKVSFDNEDTFKSSVTSLVESYFPKEIDESNLGDDLNEGKIEKVVETVSSDYLTGLNKLF